MEPEKDILALHRNTLRRSRKNTFCRTDRKTRPLPLGGRQAARFLDGLTRKPVRNSVVLPVNMTYGPGTAAKSEGFPQVVTFLKENPKMVAVASPHAQHEHDNEHGVQLKDQVRAHGPPQSPAETFAEPVELRDVIGRWVRAQA